MDDTCQIELLSTLTSINVNVVQDAVCGTKWKG